MKCFVLNPKWISEIILFSAEIFDVLFVGFKFEMKLTKD